MATIYNIAGTTSHTFTLGDGTTIFYGIENPIDSMGKVGDIYIAMKKKLSNQDDYEEVETQQDLIDFPSDYQQEEGHPLPVGFIIRLNENDASTYYKWNGSSWDELFNDNDSFGRVYYKEAFGNGSRWNFIKSYSFDTDIIHAIETSLNSNDFKIAIEYADNGSPTQESTTDYATNHSAYGVTRYATNAEAQVNAVSNWTTYSSVPTVYDSLTTKFIAETPKQIGDSIKVEMTRAINVEGYLKDLSSTNGRFTTKSNIVAAINELDTDVGKLASLNTSVKSNLVAAINDERSRAIGVEGNLSNLTTTDKTNLVNAINDEVSRATTEEASLQSQIDAITSKSDVADIVPNYASLTAYDTAPLYDNDVIKVLEDETDNNATTYYRLSHVPTTPDVTVGTKSALPAVTESDNGKIAKVTSDETHSNQTTYYECRKVDGTYEWVYASPSKTESGSTVIDTAHIWDYIGQEGSYYTKSESNARYIETAGDTMTGTLTVSGSIAADGASSVTVPTMAAGNSSTNAASTAFVGTAISNADALVVHLAGTETITGNKTFSGSVELGSSATATTKTKGDSTTAVATTAFVATGLADKAEDNAVVHLAGTETITGNKTLNSNDSEHPATLDATNGVIIVKTQTANDNSTNAASTAYVDAAVTSAVGPGIPQIDSSTNEQVLSNDGSTYYWKDVKDISKLDELEDTVIASKQSGQVLIWDSTAGTGGSGAWVNGNQVTATIRYY